MRCQIGRHIKSLFADIFRFAGEGSWSQLQLLWFREWSQVDGCGVGQQNLVYRLPCIYTNSIVWGPLLYGSEWTDHTQSVCDEKTFTAGSCFQSQSSSKPGACGLKFSLSSTHRKFSLSQNCLVDSFHLATQNIERVAVERCPLSRGHF